MSKKQLTVVGVDPGVRECGIAVLNGEEIVTASVIKVPRSIKGPKAVTEMISMVQELPRPFLPDLVVVEGQTVYDMRGQIDLKRVDPNDLIHVAQVAGACAGHFGGLGLYEGSTKLLIPEPKVWKKQIRKDRMQARMYHRMGWGYELRSGYAVPKNPPAHLSHLKGADWKEAGDAILLALWGADVYK